MIYMYTEGIHWTMSVAIYYSKGVTQISVSPPYGEGPGTELVLAAAGRMSFQNSAAPQRACIKLMVFMTVTF